VVTSTAINKQTLKVKLKNNSSTDNNFGARHVSDIINAMK